MARRATHTWTQEELERLAAKAMSKADILRAVGLKLSAGHYTTLTKYLRKYGIDTSHFTGVAHLRGKSHNWTKQKYSNDELFCSNSPGATGYTLKKRAFRLGLPAAP